MDEIDQLIDEELAKQEGLTDAQAIRAKKLLKEYTEGGQPRALKEVLHLSDDMIESLYSHAYYLYQSAKYQKASHLFRLLTNLAPTEVKFYMGIAACFQMEKKFGEAAAIYNLASYIDQEDPMPAYYESDCDIQLGRFKRAKASLRQVIERGIGKKEHQIIVDRARLTLDKIVQDHPE